MKQTLPAAILFSAMCFFSCKSHDMNGRYVCDLSQKKEVTAREKANTQINIADLTCAFREFEFKGNSTVAVKMESGEMFSSYVIDKNFIRITGGQGPGLLLRVKDKNTLVLEGVMNGVYHKQ